ncbi:hypothetical protein [Stenotrophomonas sp.]|uniref:hypothetical protein n=1 Tax=Stenotrophomonas sp. TaxID=69392 RepID=UPI0028965DDC|nr:hypothetical protein [Stenotrophomonas sp.]
MAAALESGLTTTGSTPDGGPTLTFQFHGEDQRQAACDAWRNYALALVDVSAPPACTAAQRATARLGLALFDDPTLDLMQIADKVASARAATLAALMPTHVNEMEETHNGRR